MKRLIFLTAMLILPLSTWQTFSNGVLTVYKGTDSSSGIYYQGEPAGYDGKATEKSYPYIHRQVIDEE